MKNITKLIIKIGIVVVIILSIGVNVYFIGWQRIIVKYQQQGFSSALQAIVQTVQTQGQVQIGNLILVEQK